MPCPGGALGGVLDEYYRNRQVGESTGGQSPPVLAIAGLCASYASDSRRAGRLCGGPARNGDSAGNTRCPAGGYRRFRCLVCHLGRVLSNGSPETDPTTWAGSAAGRRVVTPARWRPLIKSLLGSGATSWSLTRQSGKTVETGAHCPGVSPASRVVGKQRTSNPGADANLTAPGRRGAVRPIADGLIHGV